MIAIRFGEHARQLFGLYQPAAGAARRRHGVLLCNPFGQEAIRAHRLFRVLGERLSRAGFDVLRFDYLGTGDSDGDEADGDLPAWTADVTRAHEQLLGLGGLGRCSWFGLRLGATLAAIACARASPPPDRLVLWDPVVDGTRYLADLARSHVAELKDLHGAPRGTPTPDEASLEVLGFALPVTLQSQIRAITPSSFTAHRAAGVSVIDSGATDEIASLERHFQGARIPSGTTRIATRIAWASDEAMNTAIVPPDALQAIVDSLCAP